MKLALLLVTSLLLLGCAPRATTATKTYWEKKGGTEAQFRYDSAECEAWAKRQVPDYVPVEAKPASGGAFVSVGLGQSLAVTSQNFQGAAEVRQARDELFIVCMEVKDYYTVTR